MHLHTVRISTDFTLWAGLASSNHGECSSTDARASGHRSETQGKCRETTFGADHFTLVPGLEHYRVPERVANFTRHSTLKLSRTSSNAGCSWNWGLHKTFNSLSSSLVPAATRATVGIGGQAVVYIY